MLSENNKCTDKEIQIYIQIYINAQLIIEKCPAKYLKMFEKGIIHILTISTIPWCLFMFVFAADNPLTERMEKTNLILVTHQGVLFRKYQLPEV